VVLIALATLLVVDCVNELDSSSWTDLARAPHRSTLTHRTRVLHRTPTSSVAHSLAAVLGAGLLLVTLSRLTKGPANVSARRSLCPALLPPTRAPPVRVWTAAFA